MKHGQMIFITLLRQWITATPYDKFCWQWSASKIMHLLQLGITQIFIKIQNRGFSRDSKYYRNVIIFFCPNTYYGRLYTLVQFDFSLEDWRWGVAISKIFHQHEANKFPFPFPSCEAQNCTVGVNNVGHLATPWLFFFMSKTVF